MLRVNFKVAHLTCKNETHECAIRPKSPIGKAVVQRMLVPGG